jgi:hypothetical protein
MRGPGVLVFCGSLLSSAAAWATPKGLPPPPAEERDLAPAQSMTVMPTSTVLDDQGNVAEPASAAKPPEPEPSPEERPTKKLLESGGFDVALSFGAAHIPLEHASFSGGGRTMGTNNYQAIGVKGRDLGLGTPLFWGGEIALRYTRRYFTLGIIGGYAYGGNVDLQPTDYELSQRIDRSHMNLYAIGLELSGVVAFDPVTFRVGPYVGVRHVTAPMPGYEPTTCTRSSRYGRTSYPCLESAKATTPFIQPRASFDVSLGKGGTAPTLGAWVGVDAYPQVAWSAGVLVSLRVPFWDLAP